MAARSSIGARALAWARVLGGCLLLAAGLIVILPAQTYSLWLASVVLTEFGYLAAPLALALLWPGWHRNVAGRTSAALGVAAAVCLLTPLVRALPLAQALPARLAEAFGEGERGPGTGGDAPRRARPIEPVELFTGTSRSDMRPERLAYGRHGDTVLSLDLHASAPAPEAPPSPIVLMVHGGGWHAGDPADLPALARYLASHGYIVAAPQYRLAPAHRFPAPLDDLRAAMDFLRGRARTWGGDPDGLVVLGRSAGAHLALLAAYTAPVGAVRGAIALYGPADLRFGWEHPGNPRVYDGTGAIEALLGGPPGAVPEAYEAASPYGKVGESTPPTLLIHGRKDEIVWVEQSRRLADRLAAARRPHLLIELPWATHGCDFALAGPCGQITLFAVERFLAAVTSH
jgi:acetyl esterase/lipase